MNRIINVLYNDHEYLVEVENQITTYEELTFQVYSLTDVEPDSQRFYFLSRSAIKPKPTDKINVANEQKIILYNSKNEIYNSSGGMINVGNIKGRIENMYRTMMNYNSDRLQQLALDAVPLVIKKEADKKKKMHLLLDWFKNSYFKWVNAPDCPDETCGTPNTKAIGNDAPNQQEQLHQASRVEVYRCDSGHTIRFPRYNSVEMLLKTKSGRCGEWANAFTLFCMALGFQTRYIYDFTDHVWNEVYIDGRWVHVDSCEASYDSPLTYEGGWGKSLSYIFAFELDGVYDVTSRYSIKQQPLSTRTLAPEQDLAIFLDSLNHKIRLSLPFQSVRDILNREANEKTEMKTYPTRIYDKNLSGRVSGSTEWRSDRGELGSTLGGGSGSSGNAIKVQTPIPTIGKSIYSLDSISKARESIQLVGDCEITKNGICLTPNETDKLGAFWLKEKIDIVSGNGFTCKIKFLIKERGADGMAFVIQNDSIRSIGIGGCGLGYHGIKNSLAIEFDTYETVDHCKDPNGNHISINTRGREPNSSHHRFSLGFGVPENNRSMNDGLEHECFIKYTTNNDSYNEDDHYIDVWLDKYQVLHRVKVNLQKLLQLDSNKFAFIGCTGATGGLKQAHIISGIQISNNQS